jgi:thiamine-monophosphate kinase
VTGEVDEAVFLALLRPLATHSAARGLNDDAAVLGDLVLTHDILVEGVHFRTGDAPADVAWKLVAVNLSDLAAKGAVPLGVLFGYPLSTPEWDAGFVRGLEAVLTAFGVPLLGGDTVRGPRALSMTAIGRSAYAPARSGAKAGDALWVTGVIGRAGLGLAGDPEHEAAHLRPQPRLAEGQALAPLVTAMMDVSDGLLIDAQRMAAASGLALAIDLDAVPVAGDRMAAVTAGDDYELLFAAPAKLVPPVRAMRIGTFSKGQGLNLYDSHGAVSLPARLGYLHV